MRAAVTPMVRIERDDFADHFVAACRQDLHLLGGCAMNADSSVAPELYVEFALRQVTRPYALVSPPT